MTTQTTTTWPEGVIARYETLVGATVDLTHVDLTSDTKATRANCTGCEAEDETAWASSYPRHRSPEYIDYQDRGKGDRGAREWAQKHAEKCRALPLPSASTDPAPVDEPEPRRRLWLPTRRTKSA